MFASWIEEVKFATVPASNLVGRLARRRTLESIVSGGSISDVHNKVKCPLIVLMHQALGGTENAASNEGVKSRLSYILLSNSSLALANANK